MYSIESLKWSLRRLFIPIPSTFLVLEVGSGGNPYPRSNVLVDAYESTQERHWEPLIHDRPTVLAFGENLPFKDKSFDYVIAAHVLEHTPNPEKFLAELQRVAHGGYIETPDAFMERINPYHDHRLEVTLRDNGLLIRKKPDWIYDKGLVELYEHRVKYWITKKLIPRQPPAFHCCYQWQDKINFRIVNPEIDASWRPTITNKMPGSNDIKKNLRRTLLKIVRWIFSQNMRNRHINLLSLLRCVQCGGGHFIRQENNVVCGDCGIRHELKGNLLII
jgi:SAM-dependent methyltransferase